jgi:ribonuclease R
MPQRFTRRIVQHLQDRSYSPQRVRQLANALGVDASDHAAFREAVEKLAAEGQVVIGGADTVALPPPGREMTGRFKLHEKGFGFVIPDTPNAHGDLFVPAGQTGGALSGDRVRAEVKLDKRRGKKAGDDRSPYTGRVIQVIQRQNTYFTGVLDKRGKLWVVHVDGKMLSEPVVVRDVGAKNAGIGDKVVIELTRFPEGRQTAEGVITEVLGEPGRPDVETQAIMRAFGLEEHFPENALNEARAQVRRYDEQAEQLATERLDLRDQFIITIDPPDARDFDDAISITHEKDQWELGVHIADVASFVPVGSVLDDIAYERGNSVYLPRKVVPMLPELLSNGICSLQPGVPRLTRSVFITYDREGRVIRRRFANTVIHSAHRLTYLEAQALIDDDPKLARRHAATEQDYPDQLVRTLKQMNQLARLIRQRRLSAGMIVLDLPEVELIFDDEGHVTDAQPEDDAFTHKIIEAFMVEANEAVAQAFADLNVPAIRRIHPDPGAADTQALRRFARVAGFNVPANPTRNEMQTLLDAVRGKPAARAVHLAVLRTLTKAEYSPALIGHFALASEHYTHFTSPIRRYPDLIVHRQLQALLEASDDGYMPTAPRDRKKLAQALADDPRSPDLENLQASGSHCSATERNAEAAERELRDLLVMQLLAEHVGETFRGTVTGVTSFGLFIQIDKYLVDGMVRKTDLPGAPAEQWKLNDYTGSLVAQRSGRSITIGDQFDVKINQIDLSRREMDLLIVEDQRKSRPTKPQRGGRRSKPTRRSRRGRR